jgi:hypothetical protein
MEIAGLPSLTWPGPLRANAVAQRGLLYGTRSAVGNPLWVTVDPVVGGSLEDDFCDLIS